MMKYRFLSYIWSSSTVPKNAEKPLRLHKCLVINKGDSWIPPKGKGSLEGGPTA